MRVEERQVFEWLASDALRQGTLLAISPLIPMAGHWLKVTYWPILPPGDPFMSMGVFTLLAAVCALGTILLHTSRFAGRFLITLALCAFGGYSALWAAQDPAVAYAFILGIGAVLAWTWSGSPMLSASRTPSARAAAKTSEVWMLRGAAFGYALLWLCAVPLEVAVDLTSWILLLTSAAVFAVFLVRWHLRQGTKVSHWIWAARGIHLVFWCTAFVQLTEPALAATILVASAALAVILTGNFTEDRPSEAWWTPIVEHPARFMVVTFFATAMTGAVLLSLPMATTRPDGIYFIDAVFTAFSATCVTGLTVLDTAKDFTLFGQILILLLIQIGGLGIMAFSTSALLLFGRRLSVRHAEAVREMLGADQGAIKAALSRVLAVTFVTEAAGALTLAALFGLAGDSFWTALWRGLFTSISAFCNAGFALQSDNLVAYQRDPLIILIVGTIILIGGLGPAVIVSLPDLVRWRRAPLATKLVLVTTAIVVIGPALFIAAAEWTGTLAHLSMGDRLVNAYFQSVTLRTAGFNSIDLTQLRPATLSIMMAVMFIGGSPGSTAGGAKTTTVAILVLAILAALRGRYAVTAFGRRITHRTVYRATAIFMTGVGLVLVAFVALQLTQRMRFEVALFETISALATVGLTIGGTAELDSIGKVIIALSMYIGRVGPLTLFLLLIREDAAPRWRLPEQDAPVG